MRRHRGVLRVCIMNVKGLRAADMVGTNDVQIEVTTDSEHFEVGRGVERRSSRSHQPGGEGVAGSLLGGGRRQQEPG